MRGDGFDIERLNELERGAAWSLILARVDKMIAGEGAALESATSLTKMRRAQGAVAALRRIRSLPEILRAEIKAQLG